MAGETKKSLSTKKLKNGKMDIAFLSIVLILLTIGLVMLFSASYAYSLEYHGSSYHFIARQALFAVVGVAIMLVISKIDYHFWRKFAWLLFFVFEQAGDQSKEAKESRYVKLSQ